MEEPTTHDLLSDADFETWHVYDAGGSVLRLKVRYRGDVELPGWRDGPELAVALQAGEAEGWRAFDREPGGRPGEYAIFHMKREARRMAPS
jgi:hypothetical protein